MKKKKKLTQTEATLNMLKATLGPGCLALPFSATQAGMQALPLMLLTQAACIFSMHSLIHTKNECCHANQTTKNTEQMQLQPNRHEPSTTISTRNHQQPDATITYGDLAHMAANKPGRAIVEVAILAQQLGICAVYFNFTAQNITTILDDLDPMHVPPTRLIVLLTFPLVSLLTLVRDWKRLATLSAVANVLMLCGIAVILSFTIRRLLVHGVHRNLPAFQLRGIPVLTGQVLYAFEGIANVLPIENALIERSHMPRVVTHSQLLYALTMVLMAVLPILAYGSIHQGAIGDEIEHAHPGHGTKYILIAMNTLVTAAVLLTFPVQLYPAAEIVEGWMRKLSRSCCRRRRNEASRQIPPSVMRTLSEPLTGVSSVQIPGRVIVSSTTTPVDFSEYVHPAFSTTTEDDWYRIVLRCMLTSLTAGAAIAVPDLGLLIAFLGCFVAPLLTLFLPSFLALRLSALSSTGKFVRMLFIFLSLLSVTLGSYVLLLDLV